MKINKLNIAFMFLVGMMLATLIILLQKPWQAGASIMPGGEYQSTTTPTVADLTNLCPQRGFLASSTTGVLSSVSITNYGSGSLQIYDATTSIAANRSADQATSSIMLWGMINGMATSSYPSMDIEFKRGLLIDTSGTVGTSTIGFRCNG